MSRTVYRIGTDTPDYEADDLSGKGAEITGGRWNEKGVAVVYAAENRSLACLETLVHLAAGGLPFNRYLVEISIPDPVWAAYSGDLERPIRSIMNTQSGDPEHALALA